MTHNEMVQMFIDGRLNDGDIYFKNVNRVIHQILCMREDSIKSDDGEAIPDYKQPKEILTEIGLAFNEAKQYLFDNRDPEVINARIASLKSQREAEAKYYAEHGTKGEF